MDEILYALQLVLGIVFLRAALGKLRSPRHFVDTVKDYELLPTKVAEVTAFLIIPTEFALAAAFLSGVGLVLAIPASVIVLAAFLTAVSVNLLRRHEVECGCFGGAETISGGSAARLVGLAGGAVALAVLDPVLTTRAIVQDGDGSIQRLYEGLLFVALITVVYVWISTAPRLVGVMKEAFGGTSSRKESIRG